MAETAKIGFLVCPEEPLLEDFVLRPREADPSLVSAISRHLARCGSCREEADRLRRGVDAASTRRPWLWSAVAAAALGAGASVFVMYDMQGPLLAGHYATNGSLPAGIRRDPRIAGLARFDPPGNVVMTVTTPVEGGGPARRAALPPVLSSEDRRELAAARARLESGAWTDAARLLEDLCSRHAGRGGLRVLLAFALARAGEIEKAHWQYSLADDQGAGIEACWGRANALLRLGEIAAARRELAEHLLARDPDHEGAKELLLRLRSIPRTGF